MSGGREDLAMQQVSERAQCPAEVQLVAVRAGDLAGRRHCAVSLKLGRVGHRRELPDGLVSAECVRRASRRRRGRESAVVLPHERDRDSEDDCRIESKDGDAQRRGGRDRDQRDDGESDNREVEPGMPATERGERCPVVPFKLASARVDRRDSEHRSNERSIRLSDHAGDPGQSYETRSDGGSDCHGAGESAAGEDAEVQLPEAVHDESDGSDRHEAHQTNSNDADRKAEGPARDAQDDGCEQEEGGDDGGERRRRCTVDNRCAGDVRIDAGTTSDASNGSQRTHEKDDANRHDEKAEAYICVQNSPRVGCANRSICG